MPCPTCGAHVGGWCWFQREHGKEAEPALVHDERVTAWKASLPPTASRAESPPPSDNPYRFVYKPGGVGLDGKPFSVLSIEGDTDAALRWLNGVLAEEGVKQQSAPVPIIGRAVIAVYDLLTRRAGWLADRVVNGQLEGWSVVTDPGAAKVFAGAGEAADGAWLAAHAPETWPPGGGPVGASYAVESWTPPTTKHDAHYIVRHEGEITDE
mgnify:CR=1 FL=1